MLEGDYDVDWEVDPNEHSHAPHPHRVPLRGRVSTIRRPGAPVARAQHCLTPVGRAPAAHGAGTVRPGASPRRRRCGASRPARRTEPHGG
jgi:hypothetical protein